MTLWTDQKWWDLNVNDGGAADDVFDAAGLPVRSWINRVPIFEGKVDMKQVQGLADGSVEYVKAPKAKAKEPEEVPKEKPKAKAPAKKAVPKKKAR